MTDFRAYEAERIRRVLLDELAAQDNGSWTLAMLVRALAARGYRKSEEYVLNQLKWLEREVIAVKLTPAGEETIVRIRRAGRNHVEGVGLLAGVDKPDDEA